jgi:hypothetical protein
VEHVPVVNCNSILGRFEKKRSLLADTNKQQENAKLIYGLPCRCGVIISAIGRSWIRIPPGSKDFRTLKDCNAVLCNIICIVIVCIGDKLMSKIIYINLCLPNEMLIDTNDLKVYMYVKCTSLELYIRFERCAFFCMYKCILNY